MPDHGRLFDTFSRQASHAHGGSYFDAGFGEQVIADAHGKLYDLFGVPRDSAAHGEHFDEFGWHAMPASHGQQFDSDFRQDTALTGEHGTWFDVFRGGTEVRFMLEGADYEGTVIDCNPAFARVRSHDGQEHEVDLSQFLEYRTPNEHQASPSMPASDAEAPSARSHDAHGAFHGERASVPTDMPPVIQEVPQGQHTDLRSGLPEGLMDTFDHLKTLADELDVEKDVDSTETAAQGSPAAKTVSHRSNCPRDGSAPCGPDVDGHCALCNANVRDHEAIGKAFGASGDPQAGGQTQTVSVDRSPGGHGQANNGPNVDVPHREHKTSDHHMQLGSKPGRCPHCGGALELNDQQTEQGQPSRKDKQGGEGDYNVTAHKCTGTGIDVLKTLVEA